MGDYLTASDYRIAASNGLSKKIVYRRVMEQGWEIERAITEPVNEKNRQTGAWERWESRSVVNYQNFRTRLSRGWSEEEAALTPAKQPRGRLIERNVFDIPYFAVPKPTGSVVVYGG